MFKRSTFPILSHSLILNITKLQFITFSFYDIYSLIWGFSPFFIGYKLVFITIKCSHFGIKYFIIASKYYSRISSIPIYYTKLLIIKKWQPITFITFSIFLGTNTQRFIPLVKKLFNSYIIIYEKQYNTPFENSQTLSHN